MKKYDYIIIICAVLLFLGSFFINNFIDSLGYDYRTVNVYKHNKLIYTETLTDALNDEVVLSSDGFNHVVISGGSISIVEADCPDQICVKEGPITRVNAIRYCLPNEVLVEIVGKSYGNDVDFISK